MQPFICDRGCIQDVLVGGGWFANQPYSSVPKTGGCFFLGFPHYRFLSAQERAVKTLDFLL